MISVVELHRESVIAWEIWLNMEAKNFSRKGLWKSK